ncbi:MAG: DUF1552 domain-containing protein [Phycisphaerales bacterium]|nr:DUF1552 domain-containing protein [Phycisphaerales bacterium]
MRNELSRRTMLRGLGVSMALPMLECMAGGSRGATHAARALAGAAGVWARTSAIGAAPVRLAYVFMPNGVNYESWTPVAGATPTEFTLSPTLEALAPVRGNINVLTGLTLQRARANGDGPGDHARSSASFLTGMQARKTAGNDIRNGVSIDQVAAQSIGSETRLPSLELGCEMAPSSGNCDSGYSCAYSSNISWRDESTPMAKIVDPAAAFERLFGDATQAAAARERLARRKSILDFVIEDSRSLSNRIGAGDRRKLDQFQSAVREIERRIERARNEGEPRALPAVHAPAGIPDRLSEHFDLMYDMLLLAFQTDTTRVATLMLAVDGSNRTFPELGINEGHHQLSHHQNNREMIEKIRRIDRFHVEGFARFIKKLSEMREGEGSLLDNCLVMLGGGISDGNKHNHEDLPIVLAGRAGGTIETGRLITSPRETPLCNLYLSMLDKAGCPRDHFADSTGALVL